MTRILKVVGTQREVEVMIGLENGRAGGPEGIGPGAEKRLGTEQKCSAARGVAFLPPVVCQPDSVELRMIAVVVRSCGERCGGPPEMEVVVC